MHREGMKGEKAGAADTTVYKQSISQLDPTRLIVISTSPDECSMIVQGQ